MAADPGTTKAVGEHHIGILDGWRALSILLVLAAHLLPLGPKSWQLNDAAAPAGMAIFFTLSGFLITRFLLERPDVPDFLLRRLFRILPLAWLAIAVLTIANHADATTIAANFLFYANLPPAHLMIGGEHLWSLCVEVQFYVGVAVLVMLAGRRALWLLPVLGLAITIGRVATATPISIITWQRLDEILAGACVALLWGRPATARLCSALPTWTAIGALLALLIASHPASGPLAYLRPYCAAAAVGISLYRFPALLRPLFVSRPARYVAEISNALYVIHGMLVPTWLGTGSTLAKYAKRPLLIGLTFAAAHASTFHFERPMMALGKRLSHRRRTQAASHPKLEQGAGPGA